MKHFDYYTISNIKQYDNKIFWVNNFVQKLDAQYFFKQLSNCSLSLTHLENNDVMDVLYVD